MRSIVVNEGSVENFKIFHFAKWFAPLYSKIKSKPLINNSGPVDLLLPRRLRWSGGWTLTRSIRDSTGRRKMLRLTSYLYLISPMDTTVVLKGLKGEIFSSPYCCMISYSVLLESKRTPKMNKLKSVVIFSEKKLLPPAVLLSYFLNGEDVQGHIEWLWCFLFSHLPLGCHDKYTHTHTHTP